MQNKLLSSRMVAQMGRLAVPLLLAGLCVGSAMAGTGGSEFDQVYDTLIDWMQGTLGRIIAITMLFVGIAYGVVRQSSLPPWCSWHQALCSITHKPLSRP